MSRGKTIEMLLSVVLALCCALTAPVVVAQTPPPQQSEEQTAQESAPQATPLAEPTATPSPYGDYFMSAKHRQKIYEQNRLRPSKAILYSALLPGLGNIYAEQYLLAGLAITLTVFAATFLGYGLSSGQSNIIVLGAVTAGLAYGGGMATSLLGVSNHNRKLRQGLKVGDAEVREVWTPALVLRF